MRLVKVSAGHYINSDRIIEVYHHLAEEGLTLVMNAPCAEYTGELEPAPTRLYTIDLKGEVAQNFIRWLDTVAEDATAAHVQAAGD